MLTVTYITENGVTVTREVLYVEAHCNGNAYHEEVILVDPDGTRHSFVNNKFFVMNENGATVAKYDLAPAFARSKWANTDKPQDQIIASDSQGNMHVFNA